MPKMIETKTAKYSNSLIRESFVYRIAKIEKVSPEVISRIDDALHREIGLVAGKEQRQIGGIQILCQRVELRIADHFKDRHLVFRSTLDHLGLRQETGIMDLQLPFPQGGTHLGHGALEKEFIRLGHPGGIIEVWVELKGQGAGCTFSKAILGRTARRLMEGYVLVPEKYFRSQ